MAAPWSPMLRTKTRAMTADASGGGAHAHVNISTKLRRNSLVSDPEDMVLLREKLTKIAVGRVHGGDDALALRDDGSGYRRSSSGSATHRTEHFKVFPLQPAERPSTPPSSPQPRDVLRKQLRLKQNLVAKTGCQRAGSSSVAGSDEGKDGDAEVEGLAALMNVDEVEITSMDLSDDVTASNAVLSPPRHPQAQLSIPSHLRVMSTFSVLNKCPEGLRKRKSAHVEDACGCDGAGNRASLKKTSSQVSMAGATSAARGLPRSSSAGGELFQSLAQSAASRRRQQQQQQQDQDQDMGMDMEDVCVPSTKPQPAPLSPLFASARLEEHGRLSACS